MARPVDISNEMIINIAEKFFLEKGIGDTEMKDIANCAGVSRSSLYRHFESKESIAFEIAARILTEIAEVLTFPVSDSLSAPDALLEVLTRYMNKLIENPRWVRFLDEFDQFFSDAYPEGEASSDYTLLMSRLSNGVVDDILDRGKSDGSLHIYDSIRFTGLFLLNSIMAFAQRVIPRKEHYQQEHGYSFEYLSLLPRVLVDGISTK